MDADNRMSYEAVVLRVAHDIMYHRGTRAKEPAVISVWDILERVPHDPDFVGTPPWWTFKRVGMVLRSLGIHYKATALRRGWVTSPAEVERLATIHGISLI